MAKRTVTRNCETCGAGFIRQPNTKGRFCTHYCYGKSRITDKAAHFWPRVNKTETCWLWTGQPDSHGYGDYCASKAFRWKAHRYSYLLAHGSIPDGMHVLHKCDVPACVNPDHLFIGTHQDNMRDCVQKGRNVKGERQGSAKLTDEMVRQARKRRAEEGLTYEVLGHLFGVDRQVISKAIRGLTWAHVP